MSDNLRLNEDSLRFIRLIRGMSQTALGELIGAKQISVSLYERGLKPTAETVAKLAGALNVHVDALLLPINQSTLRDLLPETGEDQAVLRTKIIAEFGLGYYLRAFGGLKVDEPAQELV